MVCWAGSHKRPHSSSVPCSDNKTDGSSEFSTNRSADASANAKANGETDASANVSTDGCANVSTDGDVDYQLSRRKWSVCCVLGLESLWVAW